VLTQPIYVFWMDLITNVYFPIQHRHIGVYRCVYWAVRTESLNIFEVNFRLSSVKSYNIKLCLYPEWFCIETDQAFSLKFTLVARITVCKCRDTQLTGTNTLGSLSYFFFPTKISVYVSCSHSCIRTHAQIRSVIRFWITTFFVGEMKGEIKE
jgi:hypothetical protein